MADIEYSAKLRIERAAVPKPGLANVVYGVGETRLTSLLFSAHKNSNYPGGPRMTICASSAHIPKGTHFHQLQSSEELLMGLLSQPQTIKNPYVGCPESKWS